MFNHFINNFEKYDDGLIEVKECNIYIIINHVKICDISKLNTFG
jgi:hypothetical protein